MAGGKTHFLEEKILRSIFMSLAAYKPAGIYLTLFTAAPTDDGGGTEPAGLVRFPIVQADSSWTLTPGSGITPAKIVNAIEALWTNVGWGGTITAWGFMDQSSGGNLLYYLDCPDQAVAVGNTVRFASGTITVQED